MMITDRDLASLKMTRPIPTLLQAATIICFGVLFTCGVAWLIAITPQGSFNPISSSSRHSHGKYEAVGRTTNTYITVSRGEIAILQERLSFGYPIYWAISDEEFTALLPKSSRLNHCDVIDIFTKDRKGDKMYVHSYKERYTGWPFLSLGFNVAEDEMNNVVRSSGMVILPRCIGRYLSRDCLPMMPLWGGILANSALYSVCVWILACVGQQIFWVVRLRVRTRQGRCYACGYDLRGHKKLTTCSECRSDVRTNT